MFTIVDQPIFRHPVTLRVPVDGGYRDETLTVTYRVLPVDEAEKFDLGAAKSATSFLRAVVSRIDDLTDANGNPVAYSDDLRERVIKLPYARAAIARAYFEAVAGAKEGN